LDHHINFKDMAGFRYSNLKVKAHHAANALEGSKLNIKAATGEKRHLLNLPVEMRDAIYDFLIPSTIKTNVTSRQSACIHEVRLQVFPCSGRAACNELITVCKQINAELAPRMEKQKSKVVLVIDASKDPNAGKKPGPCVAYRPNVILKNLLKHIRHVDLINVFGANHGLFDAAGARVPDDPPTTFESSALRFSSLERFTLSLSWTSEDSYVKEVVGGVKWEEYVKDKEARLSAHDHDALKQMVESFVAVRLRSHVAWHRDSVWGPFLVYYLARLQRVVTFYIDEAVPSEQLHFSAYVEHATREKTLGRLKEVGQEDAGDWEASGVEKAALTEKLYVTPYLDHEPVEVAQALGTSVRGAMV
jgi:hypothetical protein